MEAEPEMEWTRSRSRRWNGCGAGAGDGMDAVGVLGIRSVEVNEIAASGEPCSWHLESFKTYQKKVFFVITRYLVHFSCCQFELMLSSPIYDIKSCLGSV